MDTLASTETTEIREEKYIPPKTRKHLSPSVRKIVEENNIDVSNIKGTGKAGRISKGDLIQNQPLFVVYFLVNDVRSTINSVYLPMTNCLTVTSVIPMAG